MIDKFYDDLKKLQYQSETDTILEVDGKDINVHSFILVARSEYFRAMVHFEEGHVQRIKLDFDSSLVVNIVNYLYNGYKAL